MEEVNRRRRIVLQVQVEELHLGFSLGPLDGVDAQGLCGTFRWASFRKALSWVGGANLAAISTRPAHGGP